MRGKIPALAMAAFLAASASAAPYSGGTGEPNDPYQIAAVADWQQLMTTSASWDKHFILTAALDLQGVALTPVAADTSTDYGFQGTEFTGVFDGQGFTLRNAVIDLPDSDYVGLFGRVGSGGELRDLGVENVNITGEDWVGGLVGLNRATLTSCYAAGEVTGDYFVGGLVGWNRGTLTSCYATGQVTGNWDVGGLAGENDGTLTSCYAAGRVTGTGARVGGLVAGNWGPLTSCYATGHVSGDDEVGGLVGDNGGTLTSCYATGQVTGTGYDVGGLVGYNYPGTLTSCYATGDVTGTHYSVGGLVGSNGGTLTSCYATGNVTGVYEVGGLVGENWDGRLTSCYAMGQVTGYICVGGLVGKNWDGTLTSCYATGHVTGDDGVGGLVGGNYDGTVTACFWDTQTSGQDGSVGGKGLTTEQMKTMRVFQNAGWADYDWAMQDRIDYPRLAWENTAGIPIPAPEPVPLTGSGTQAEPYQVATAADFALLSWYVSVLDKHVVLMTDLDLTGVQLYPIGHLGAFTGVFEGQGFTLRNAVICLPGSDFVGLFSYIDSGGEIHDLGAEDVNITGRDCVGSLVGYSGRSSTLTSCYATGHVTGDWLVGGLVGLNRATLTSCYAAGEVTGDYFVGGLVGENDGTLTSCYATGQVTGTGDYVGGLVGYDDEGTLASCYATGQVTGDNKVGGLVGWNRGTLTSCYATGQVTGNWDVGGLAGENDGTLTSCYAAGRVTGTGARVGGLVAGNLGPLTSCYATGHVTGDDGVGGLVGYNGGTLTSCYATGQVTGNWDVGGLVGSNTFGTLTSCYATGQVTGTHDKVGGLVGDNDGTITSCYATAQVTGVDRVGGLVGRNWYYGTITSCYGMGQVVGETQVGGLVGDYHGGRVTACFWDIETSGQTPSAGGEGKTTAQMQDINTFLDAGWDFVGESENGTEDFWKMIRDGEDYPRLSWQVEYPPDIAGLYGVDLVDFAFLANYWLDTNCADSNDCNGADVDFSGDVDTADLRIFCDHWLAGSQQ